MEAQVDNYQDLGSLLKQLYGDYLIEWTIDQDNNVDYVYSMGNASPVGIHLSRVKTTLHIGIKVPELDLLRMRNAHEISSTIDFAALITVRDVPHFTETRDPYSNSRLITFSFQVESLEEFTKLVKEATWRRFNKVIGHQIDSVLDIDDM